MTTTEAERLRLLHRLEEVLGPDEASTLMDHLPPLGWSDVATKHDLDAHRFLTRSDLDVGMAELRTEMADLRTELRTEMADLRNEMVEFRTEIRTDMADLRAEMHIGFRNQTLAMVTLMFTIMALYTGLVVTVLR